MNWLRPPSSIYKGWKCTIPHVKDFLGADTDEEAVSKAAEGISGALKAWAGGDGTLWGVDSDNAGDPNDPHYCFFEVIDQLDFIVDDPDLSWFNSVLDDLYDWADDERFIVGGDPVYTSETNA